MRNFWLPSLIAVLAWIVGLHWKAIYFPGNYTYDEGVYLMTLKSLREGHELYKEIYYSQLPLYMRMLDFFSPTEFSTASVRWLTWMHLPLLLASLGTVAYLRWGRVAALLTVVTIAVDPAIYGVSHVVLGNLPALSFAALSWLLLELYNRRRKYGWLILSALSFVVAVQIKAIVAPAGLPLLAVLFFSRKTNKEFLKDTLLWGFSLASLSLLLLGLTGYQLEYFAQLQGGGVAKAVDMQSFSHKFSQLLRYITVPAWGVVENIDQTRNSFLLMAGLIVAIYGFFTLDRKILGPVLVWWITALATLLIYQPVWEHHLILLSPSLALGIGSFFSNTNNNRTVIILKTILVASLVGATTLNLIPLARHDYAASQWDLYGGEIQRRIQKHSKPEDLILSDEPYFTFASGHDTLPSMIDVSRVRILSQSLTCDDVLKAASDPKVKIIVAQKRFALIECTGGVFEKISPYFSKQETLGKVRLFYK